MFIANQERWIPGVLSKSQTNKLIDESCIGDVSDDPKSRDYSSIDLHITEQGYKMLHGSLKPSEDHSYFKYLNDPNIAEKLEPDSEYFYLQKNTCYVFVLQEKIFPKLGNKNIYGQATAKSSIGRLDIIARLIVDGMSSYEEFDPACPTRETSNMFVEVIPISFPIKVKKDCSFNQLRFFYGKPKDCTIQNEDFIKSLLIGSDDGRGYLSVDVQNSLVANIETATFCATDKFDGNCQYIDLSLEEEYPPWNYWKMLKSVDEHLILHHNNFYLLKSKERINLPAGIAVYAKAMDETLGEMRIHYAGFVHPFFGDKRDDGEIGTPLIFEVRAHNVNVTLAHGEKLARLVFYRMSEDATFEKACTYNKQALQLSKHFKPWPTDKLKIDMDGNLSYDGE
jgi:dCTP deaminase